MRAAGGGKLKIYPERERAKTVRGYSRRVCVPTLPRRKSISSRGMMMMRTSVWFAKLDGAREIDSQEYFLF